MEPIHFRQFLVIDTLDYSSLEVTSIPVTVCVTIHPLSSAWTYSPNLQTHLSSPPYKRSHCIVDLNPLINCILHSCLALG